MRFEWRPLQPGEVDHELIWSVMGLCVMGGVGSWVALWGLPPVQCAFHELTSYPCLTCGSTRALVGLLRGDSLSAFRLNPLCALCWAGWLLYVPYGLITSLGKLPRLRLRLSSRDWFALRFLIPTAAIVNWIWLIWDKR